jgi:para-aminobenzoate synthetase component 1
MQIGSFGRYSLVGCDPFAVLRAKDEDITVTGHGAREVRGNPFDVLDELLAEHELPCDVRGSPGDRLRSHGKPVPLGGGLVGYLGYDLGRHLERLPRTTLDDLAVPDLLLGAYDVAYGYDHQAGEGYILSTGLPERGARAEARARERAAWLKDALSGPRAPRVGGPASHDREPARNFTREGYLGGVARAIEYIYAGDIFQVNLSQRFDAALRIPAWELYLRLRERNPAPFAAYLDLGEIQVVSTSPERFVRATGRCLQTRPIKGTRPRGATLAEDRRLTEELLASAKDRAELTMIVDLERNDFGRVCSFGSVKVPDLFALESYPTVHHLVATVTGELSPDRTYVDLLRASLPGGSITGAPKVRSMEIIDELEPTQRGVYTGCIGYIGFDWEMDLNIVIRTFTVARGRAYWQVGGGIVADSTPEAEYQETLDKGLALAEALGFEAPA